MASNHVHHPDHSLQNGAMFAEGHDGYGFNNVYSHGQPYSTNLLVDQQHQHLNGTPSHSPYNSTSAFSPPPTAWQNTATSSSQSTPVQGNPYSTANRGYYGMPTSNAQPPFQNASHQASHGMQYAQPYDPSLSRQGDPRSFDQAVGMFSSGGPHTSATIAPSALHPASTLNRQMPSPGVAMQTVFSAQQVANPPRLPVNESSTSQTFKMPRGTTSGNFIVITADDLAKATQTNRLHNFVDLGQIPLDLPYNKAATVPNYVPRKSINELKALTTNDPTLRTKIMKRQKKTQFHVSKYAPGTPKSRVSTIDLSSGSDSSDSDSDGSSYESDSPEPEPFPIPGPRPQKAIEIVRYDTIKAVWLPRNKFAENEKILKGLQDLWEVVRTIRDRWKADREAVKKATETKKASELPLLKERVEKQLEMMEEVMKASVAYGHPDLLSACGQNGPLMAVCYQFLLEPIRENDYSGSFTKAAFKFLTMCTNLNGDLAEKSNLSKILSRASKRGTEDIKVMAKKIDENIAAQNKKPKSSVLKAEPKIKGEPDSSAGVKRPRSAEPNAGQAAKRVASGDKVPGQKESTVSKLGLVKKTATTSAPTSTTTTKPKTVAKPPTNFFPGLQSASKKPGTNNATLATKPKIPVLGGGEKKGPAPAAAISAPRPAFSFAETMANLSKEREQVPVKKEEDKRPAETPEDKAKRLRKEERRKLRVSWKPDAALVEIRTFSRDPSEMPGNTSNVRDVRDGKEKEGLMFKQHMEMMDVDVDEEDDTPMEQSYFEYKDPVDIDFSSVPQSETGRNYERFGGLLKVDSPEQKVQDNHEMTTLMVHYLVKSDIPPCPKEPADPYTGPQAEFKEFGYPDSNNQWLLDRLSKYTVPAVAAPQTDISALLQAIGASNLQPQQAVAPVVPDLSALHNIVAQINGTQTTTQTAPPQQSFAWPQVTQPAAPADANASQNKPLEAILAELSGNPVPAPQAAAPVASPAAAPIGDVTALLAMLQNSQAATGAAPATNAYQDYEGYGIPATSSQEGQNNYFGSSSSAPTQYEYSSSNANNTAEQDRDRAAQKRKWQGNPGKKFLFPCRFWKDGKCKKGAACTFKHD